MLPESLVKAIRNANDSLMSLAFLPENNCVVVKRRAVCGECGIENKLSTPWGPHCRHCLCNLSLKTRAEWTSCPLGKW